MAQLNAIHLQLYYYIQQYFKDNEPALEILISRINSLIFLQILNDIHLINGFMPSISHLILLHTMKGFPSCPMIVSELGIVCKRVSLALYFSHLVNIITIIPLVRGL